MGYFTPRLFKFLRDLKTHNARPWFESNRARYEADVKEPMLRFINDLGPDLRKISPHLVAAAHPFAEDLKLKDFTTGTKFSDSEVCAQSFMSRYLEGARAAAPLMQFLTKALQLPW